MMASIAVQGVAVACDETILAFAPSGLRRHCLLLKSIATASECGLHAWGYPSLIVDSNEGGIIIASEEVLQHLLSWIYGLLFLLLSELSPVSPISPFQVGDRNIS